MKAKNKKEENNQNVPKTGAKVSGTKNIGYHKETVGKPHNQFYLPEDFSGGSYRNPMAPRRSGAFLH